MDGDAVFGLAVQLQLLSSQTALYIFFVDCETPIRKIDKYDSADTSQKQLMGINPGRQ